MTTLITVIQISAYKRVLFRKEMEKTKSYSQKVQWKFNIV